MTKSEDGTVKVAFAHPGYAQGKTFGSVIEMLRKAIEVGAHKIEVAEIPYAELTELKAKLATAIQALEEIDTGYATQNDCIGCDFGPGQSTEHYDDCVYKIARTALASIKGEGTK